FINDAPIYVFFDLISDSNSLGSYTSNDIISIYLDYEKLSELMVLIRKSLKKVERYNKNEENYLKKQIKDFFKQQDDIILTLQHELQHAFDDYRSNGKYIKNKQYNNYRKHKDELDYDTRLKQYLNLSHEIWARFTEAISKIYEHPHLASNKKFNEIWEEFKRVFKIKNITDENTIKRLQKALYKYHEKYGKTLK
ncbi:MAG: hypothetical protein ACOC2W_04630, partial [bacterium]